MTRSKAKYIKLFLMAGSVAGLFILGIPVAIFFLSSLAALHLSGLLKTNPVAIRKVAFDRESGRFKAFFENKTSSPLKLTYAIRSITPAPMPNAEGAGGLKAGFMQGSSIGAQSNYLLLSENTKENLIEPGRESIIESNDAATGMWTPGLQSNVNVTVSYAGSGAKRQNEITMQLPLELSNTHPYLREVGAARSFMMTGDDGCVIGSANSLAELAAQISQNRPSFLSHMEKNDIQRWVRDVIGDAILHDRLCMLGDVGRDELPVMASELIKMRIAELNYRDFRGIHPLLSEVEDWHAFNLKTAEDNVVCACRSLTHLFNALFKSGPEAVAFHTSRGNDFAAWIEDVVGDRLLAERIKNVDTTNTEQARAKISLLIYRRIQELR
jgi:hypothetical protein